MIEERVTLDDPIGRWLPAELVMAPEVAAITLGQLATYTSGLPRLPDNFAPAELADPFSLSARAGTGGRIILHQNGNLMPVMRRGDVPGVRFPAAEELAEGSYQLAPGLVFDVTRRGVSGKLTGQPALPVFATAGGPDRFEYDVVEAALVFERDAADVVGAVVLHQHGVAQRAARVEELKN